MTKAWTPDTPFLYDCKSCKRQHIVTMQECPSCNSRSGQLVPTPKSKRVYEACHASYKCDGCEAYEDRYR